MDYFPLVSIALCTYNGANYLEEQLDSIINQTYPNIEIVIVDDYSTDNTIEILREYEAEFNKFSIFINESNKGVNYTFSKAISLCNGEFIAISDQDDIWFPNKIEQSLRHIKDDVVMVYSNSLLIDEVGNHLDRYMFGNKKLYSGNDPRSLSLYNNIAGHTMMFRTSIRANVLPIPLHCHYDWWIGFVAVNFGKIICLDSPFVMHRIHSSNVSGYLSSIQQDRFKAMSKWIETILTIQNLKYKPFFEELFVILDSKSNASIKKVKLIFFQIKYSRFIFPSKSFFSRFDRARKLKFPYIPL